MRINTRLKLNSIMTIALTLFMIPFLAWSIWEASKADRDVALVAVMGKTAFERTVLRDEYLLNQEGRSRIQWDAKTEEFRSLLKAAVERFTEAQDKELLEQIQNVFNETVSIFSRLTEIHERGKNIGEVGLPSPEGEKRLIGQILLKAYDLTSSIDRLSELAQKASTAARDRSALLVVIFMGVVVITIIGNSAVINSILTKRVAELREGTVIIGSGDLEHRIRINGDDELSDLARASNEMAGKLKESHTSLENLQREVAERKRAEDALRESEGRLRRAEAMGHLGNWSLDLRRNRISWSDEMYRIYGVTQENFEPTYGGLMKLVHPEDREYHDQVTETIRRDGKCEFEYRVVRPDGEPRHVTGSGEVVRDEQGEAVAMFGMVLDTTELTQKKRELIERNTELEGFTYMISHDLRSPLVTVKTFLGYLEGDLSRSDADRIGQDMLYIRNAADKMGRLLDELIEMSRVGRIANPPVRVTFRETVEEALSAVAGSIAERGVEVRVGDDAIALHGDRPRLVAIWQNLVENSVKFMGDQGSPHIEMGAERCGQDTVFFVRDNGMGIDPRYRTKVFGLFEKLNPMSVGGGLGLALIKRIVELYRGTIWLESEGLGHGVCFRFTLPGALEDRNVGEES